MSFYITISVSAILTWFCMLFVQTNELYQLASVAFCLLVAWVCILSLHSTNNYLFHTTCAQSLQNYSPGENPVHLHLVSLLIEAPFPMASFPVAYKDVLSLNSWALGEFEHKTLKGKNSERKYLMFQQVKILNLKYPILRSFDNSDQIKWEVVQIVIISLYLELLHGYSNTFRLLKLCQIWSYEIQWFSFS